jgi:hypothetical protein
LPFYCRTTATAKKWQNNGKGRTMQTETEVLTDASDVEALPVDTYTRMQLYWAFNQYRETLGEVAISDRTFRYWRQVLEIKPDKFGLFWSSDLSRLKDAAWRVATGQTLEQVAAMYKAMEEEAHANS